MPLIQLQSQHPGDVLDHAVSFTSWLDTGDALTGSPVVVVQSGLTLTPSGRPAPAIAGADVVFWLSGGVSGTTYNVELTVATTGGRTRVVDCAIAITDPTS